MVTSVQIKQIHTLKSILGLDDELYRDMLASFDVQTSKNLTNTEAEILVDILQEKVNWMRKKKYKKYMDLDDREDMATPSQLRFIDVLWADITGIKDQAEHNKTLRTFCQKRFHIGDKRFMNKEIVGKVITALKNMKKRKDLKEA